jgi:hypothetical protein
MKNPTSKLRMRSSLCRRNGGKAEEDEERDGFE